MQARIVRGGVEWRREFSSSKNGVGQLEQLGQANRAHRKTPQVVGLSPNATATSVHSPPMSTHSDRVLGRLPCKTPRQMSRASSFPK